jgi:hypothetical protein
MSETNKQDVYCPSPLLDPSLFPTGSANFLNPNFNILPFLCQLLQVANDETIDPILVRPPEFDLTPFTDFSGLATVGDPRASLGFALSATFINFLPRIITQTEVLQSGGSQIIDNYICDQDGQPIKESKVLPALLSLDLSGNKPFKYGALEIPPINVALEELLRPITPEEVKDFVNNFVQGSKNNNSDYLVQFLNTWFLFDSRWKPSLHSMLNGGMFFVKLEFYETSTSKNYQKSLYLKYYEDEKNQLGCALNIPNISIHQGDIFGNTSLSRAIGASIFNYKDIVSKPLNEQQEFYNSLIKNFVTLKTQEYSIQDLFNPNIPLSTYQSMFSTLTSQYFTPAFYTNQSSISSIPIDISQCSV